MPVASKKRASKQAYQSLGQLTINGFETPFTQKLDPGNRWVKLASQIPWDQIVGVYLKQLRNHSTGASSINPRVVLGAVMIKHIKNLSDEETIFEIQENVYLQYFITAYRPFVPTRPGRKKTSDLSAAGSQKLSWC
jgi:hypothetical protein